MTNNTRALVEGQIAQGVTDPKAIASALDLSPAAVRHHLRAIREGAPAPGGRRPDGQTREAVLSALASRPFVTRSLLAPELGISPRAVGAVLEALHLEGLASREARGVYVAKKDAPSSTPPRASASS